MLLGLKIGVVYLEGAYKMVNDGVSECVLQKFEGVVSRIFVLYFWYNHTTSISNGWVGGLGLWGWFRTEWFCFHSYSNLVAGMFIKCLPFSS